MIPKMSFPIEKLQLVPLYQDTGELERIKASTSARQAFSKVRAAYHELYFPAPGEDRPYIFSSMVLSLDGKMAFPDNPQGPVVAAANAIDPEGGLTDFWVLNVLRAHADAIVVGARTLKAEPEAVFACFDPELVAERQEVLGKAAKHPLTVVVSLDGSDVPFEHALFSSQELPAIIATSRQGGQYLQGQLGEQAQLIGPFNSPEEVDQACIAGPIEAGMRAGKKVILMTGESSPDARTFLYALRKTGVEHLLIESPTYTWLLMDQGMLDEFFVDYSSLYIGGPLTPGYGSGFSYRSHPHAKFLVIALHHNSFIFTRQKLVYGLQAA